MVATRAANGLQFADRPPLQRSHTTHVGGADDYPAILSTLRNTFASGKTKAAAWRKQQLKAMVQQARRPPLAAPPPLI